MIGIYKIRNKNNNKIYIGKSINIEERLKQHFIHLDKNAHRNKNLQKDYNLFGRNCFESSILHICDETHLDRMESIYCYKNNVWNKDKGYNIAKLLDYRIIPHEEALQLKNNFLKNLFQKNKELINTKGRIHLNVNIISEKMNINKEKLIIALKTINNIDSDNFKCHFEFTSYCGSYKLKITTYDYHNSHQEDLSDDYYKIFDKVVGRLETPTDRSVETFGDFVINIFKNNKNAKLTRDQIRLLCQSNNIKFHSFGEITGLLKMNNVSFNTKYLYLK